MASDAGASDLQGQKDTNLPFPDFGFQAPNLGQMSLLTPSTWLGSFFPKSLHYLSKSKNLLKVCIHEVEFETWYSDGHINFPLCFG
jgi:hypothetical protein